MDYAQTKIQVFADVGDALIGVDSIKADKAFKMAWDYGHADGTEAVIQYFFDLLDLIKN